MQSALLMAVESTLGYKEPEAAALQLLESGEWLFHLPFVLSRKDSQASKKLRERQVQAQAKYATLAIGKIAHVHGKRENTSVQ